MELIPVALHPQFQETFPRVSFVGLFVETSQFFFFPVLACSKFYTLLR